MYDANKLVTFQAGRLDPESHLLDLEHWSPLVAHQRAAAEDIELTEEHFAVIYCLRERFRVRGPAAGARELMRELDAEFAAEGGRRYLYGLFPRGPIVQGCRIAALPLPSGTLDLSFGSVH
jgi:tRNA 2-thiouridine synthesizing protein E